MDVALDDTRTESGTGTEMHSDYGSAKAKSYGPTVPVPAPQHYVFHIIFNDKSMSPRFTDIGIRHSILSS